MTRAILLAAEAGFSHISHGQHTIFLALQSCNKSQVSNGKKYPSLFQTIQNETNRSRNYKVNFTMFLTIKAVKNRIVVFRKCEELQILFADFIVFP